VDSEKFERSAKADTIKIYPLKAKWTITRIKKENDQRRYRYLVFGKVNPYFVKKKTKKNHFDSTKKLSKTGDFVDRTYAIELEIKDTTDTDRSSSYPGLHFEIDSKGRLRTKLYDKRYYFNFLIVNFPFTCSYIPTAPVYGVYIYQLIQYSRAYDSYQFLDKGLLLTRVPRS
jgi:hypothetical protein